MLIFSRVTMSKGVDKIPVMKKNVRAGNKKSAEVENDGTRLLHLLLYSMQ
jgi:hypothetical protein